jgi:hypothetical protein
MEIYKIAEVNSTGAIVDYYNSVTDTGKGFTFKAGDIVEYAGVDPKQKGRWQISEIVYKQKLSWRGEEKVIEQFRIKVKNQMKWNGLDYFGGAPVTYSKNFPFIHARMEGEKVD